MWSNSIDAGAGLPGRISLGVGQLHEDVLKQVIANRARVWALASENALPNFEVRDYVMFAKVQK